MKMIQVKITLFVFCTALLLTGCGNSSSTVSTSIFSDQLLDGDIEGIGQPPSSFIVTQGNTSSMQSVFAGVDPNSGNESRAFLDFHLDGTNGIPGNAIIDDATLDIYIDSISADANTIPVRIDLVSFDQSTIIDTDYDRTIQPALAYITISPDISVTEVGHFVSLDVTALMQEAQNNGLNDFQIRILEDFGTSTSGLIEIDDRTGSDRSQYAPYLSVTYH